MRGILPLGVGVLQRSSEVIDQKCSTRVPLFDVSNVPLVANVLLPNNHTHLVDFRGLDQSCNGCLAFRQSFHDIGVGRKIVGSFVLPQSWMFSNKIVRFSSMSWNDIPFTRKRSLLAILSALWVWKNRWYLTEKKPRTKQTNATPRTYQRWFSQSGIRNFLCGSDFWSKRFGVWILLD